MKYCFFVLFSLFSIVSFGQTILVQGPQTGVWDADTVMVIDDVKVVDSLTIMPGATVLFNGFYGISVTDGAKLTAHGNANDSIVFTVRDTTGFSVYNSGCGGWNGFLLQKAGKVSFDYCKLQYGKAADTLDQRGGAMRIWQSNDVEIANTTFHCNFAREDGGAINAEESTLDFSNCSINDNKVYTGDPLFYMYGGGARFLKCDLVMTDMEFVGNYGPTCVGGALSLDSCSVVLDRGRFAYNIGINGGAFYMMRCNDKVCRVSNLLIHDNWTDHFGGGMAFADASPEVYNVTVTRNSSHGVNCNGVFYYSQSAPKMTNCIIYGNYPTDEDVLGDTIQQWIWTFEGFAPEFHNCLIEKGLKQFTAGNLIQVYENNIELAPGFVDPENDDFHLREDSPCRDAGDMATPDYILESLDLQGLPRLANGRVDIGAYEYSPAAVEELVADASVVSLLGNPLTARSRLELRLDEDGEVVVRLVSVLGRTVAEQSYGWHRAGVTVVDLGAMVDRLDDGVYLVETLVNDKSYILKTIK
ncbi:MAG: right-handed parallel beta-helix repeat-containing protein [Bacteroidales bacterium]|nr:right-handed parallel beta-helix repeat-containing protein [Bacteroidales bacterium]